MIRALALVLGSALIWGCQQEHVESAAVTGRAGEVQPVQYEQIYGMGGTLMRPVSLCELTHMLKGHAGLYTVRELLGKNEPALPGGGHGEPFTYVTLRLVEAWTAGAPEMAVVRTPGGPVPDGTRGWLVDLKIGEDIGIHLFHAGPNKGYFHLHPLGVWKYSSNGTLTNGQVTMPDPAMLKTYVGAIAISEGAGCPYDMAPAELPAKPSLPPDDGAPIQPIEIEVN